MEGGVSWRRTVEQDQVLTDAISWFAFAAQSSAVVLAGAMLEWIVSIANVTEPMELVFGSEQGSSYRMNRGISPSLIVANGVRTNGRRDEIILTS